jgi:hypothetical protein
VYARCLVCRAPFPRSDVLEHVPVGDRVAYDLEKGRLWVVCRRCRRWSLAPIETRWEALEELERLVTGGARGRREVRLLSRTDHVGLFEAGPLEIVRIGGAELVEAAWWRYGTQLTEARPLERTFPAFFRHLRYGSVAWRGEKTCPGCGHLFTELPYHDRKILIVRPEEAEDAAERSGGKPRAGVDHDARPSLVRRCPRCRDTEEGGLHLEGVEAELTLARVLAFENFAGASRDLVRAATRIIEDAGGASTLVRLLTRYGRPIGDLPPIGTTALEIFAAEAQERTRLRLEVEELKACWRREEELAALVDGDLTPLPLLESLVRRVRAED